MFSVLVCATESALTAFNGTESQVLQAVTACLNTERAAVGGRRSMIDWSFRGWAHGQLNAAACSLELLSLLKCFCICIFIIFLRTKTAKLF